jgi:hypothetical protein
MPRLTCLLALSFLSQSAGIVAQEKAGEVSLKEVKFDGLKETVLKHRGKVVFVDFWNNY